MNVPRGTAVVLALCALTWTACSDPWVEGQAALEAGDFELALEHFERVSTTHEFFVETHDLLPEVRFQAGRQAYDDGRWRDAIDLLRRVDSKARRDEAQDLIGCSLCRLGAAALQRGELREAARLSSTVRDGCSCEQEARQVARQALQNLDADS